MLRKNHRLLERHQLISHYEIQANKSLNILQPQKDLKPGNETQLLITECLTTVNNMVLSVSLSSEAEGLYHFQPAIFQPSQTKDILPLYTELSLQSYFTSFTGQSSEVKAWRRSTTHTTRYTGHWGIATAVLNTT